MSTQTTALFKTLPAPDRQQTQLAYRVHYWPWNELSDTGKDLVTWRKKLYMQKGTLLDQCEEGLTILNSQGRQWHICWAYNNMPTQDEWERNDNKRLISVELRASPAIADYAVAILSWELPSERLQAIKNGEL